MSLFLLLFLMVLQSVSTNLWCRKWAVVLWQEMKPGLSAVDIEPQFVVPAVFRHQYSFKVAPELSRMVTEEGTNCRGGTRTSSSGPPKEWTSEVCWLLCRAGLDAA